MDTRIAMDKKRMNPIVAQRDDMIGRPNSDPAASNGSPRKEKNGGNGGGAGGMSGGWKFLVLIAFFGLVGAGGFGLLQYQELSGKHILARFVANGVGIGNVVTDCVNGQGNVLQSRECGCDIAHVNVLRLIC